jgi:pyruvate/2-oxoglutarate dehydrogenase complex dihydrolipoamide acyltransferase (E2) component
VSSWTTDLIDVTMPQMGVSVVEGTIVAWPVAVGDTVEAEQTICEISTDKIDSEIPSPVTGVLTEILVQTGETVQTGTVLARISDSGTAASRPVQPPTAPAPVVAQAGTRRYSPVVQRVAAHHDVDLTQVRGTGRGGRVTKKDVLAHLEGQPGSTAVLEERSLHSESPYRPDPPTPAAAPVADEFGGVAAPLTRMRQSIGLAMRDSLATAATCTTVVECDMSQVEARRRQLGLTALPLIARAAIDTLREFPELNATLAGTTLTRYERVHLGIAVSLDADGLIVPVIRDAQQLAPEGLGARIRALALRARAKQLSPDEVRGATFTITNPGQYGALIATPVILQPQVAILDVEAIVKRPVVVEAAGGDAIAIRPVAHLCMSWDHRALDGVYAAQFLTALRRRLEPSASATHALVHHGRDFD